MAYLARLQNSWLDYFLHPFLKFVYNKFIGLRVSDGKVAAAIIQPIMTMEYEKNKEVIKSVRENEKVSEGCPLKVIDLKIHKERLN